MNLDSLPREPLRAKLAALGVARERHHMRQLVAMLPVRLEGQPFADFDAGGRMKPVQAMLDA
jgi:hypothetical protein